MFVTNAPNLFYLQNGKYNSQKNNKGISSFQAADCHQVKHSGIPYKNLCLLSFWGYEIKPSKRIMSPDYVNARFIDEINKARYLYGDKAVIDLGMGNPDLVPPEEAKNALKSRVDNVWSHRYNSPQGEWFFRKKVSDWFAKRFGVDNLNPNTEIMMSAGASDAIDMILAAYTEKGDKILVPNPGYSVYKDLLAKNDLKSRSLNLYKEDNYLPDFDKITKEELDGVKGMILNYPHNPTGVFATKEFYEKAVKFAKGNNLFIIHDFDNTELTYTGEKPIGILQAEGAKEVAFEVHSLSKAHNMPGLRIGFVASNPKFIADLRSAKLLYNNSVYTAVQAAACAALEDKENYIGKVNQEHRNRKNICIDRLKKLGSDAKPTMGTYYLWVKIPAGFTSDEFYKYVLHKANVALTPGTLFGENGEGFVRIVMSADAEKLNEAFDKIEKANIRFDTPKNKLPEEVQREIKDISEGRIDVVPKQIRDLNEYKKELLNKHSLLSSRLSDKPECLKAFLPDKESIENLSPYILRNNQKVYLQNNKFTSSCMGEIKEIIPFSPEGNYKEIDKHIKDSWIPYVKEHNSNASVLPDYMQSKFYPDATYITLWTDSKEEGKTLQGVVNVEIQKDGNFWVRSLNTAPWNQGDRRLIHGTGTALMARIVGLCIETNRFPLMLASTPNEENAKFYKDIGMKKSGTRVIRNKECPVYRLDKEDAVKFVEEYSRYLSF